MQKTDGHIVTLSSNHNSYPHHLSSHILWSLHVSEIVIQDRRGKGDIKTDKTVKKTINPPHLKLCSFFLSDLLERCVY